MLTFFGMIWNCDNFLKWNTKSSKILYTFKKSYLFKIYCWKKWHNGEPINTMNNFFQNISSEDLSLCKKKFGQKDSKKENSPKCKVNTLACSMLFGHVFSCFENLS
jgi:hypothetical protein